MTFEPLPREEIARRQQQAAWDKQQKADKELQRKNAVEARRLLQQLARQLPEVNKAIGEHRCQGCRQKRPLIMYGTRQLCRECANGRDAYLAQHGAPLFVDTQKGYL